MRVLLAEYTVAHDPTLAPEGAAMLAVLRKSFERCGYEVVHPGRGDFLAEIKRLAPDSDAGLVIAPDPLLFRYTAALERLTHNIGCGSLNAAVCANKQQTAAILSRHSIPVPDETAPGKRVIKPVLGCGAQGVRLADTDPGPGEFSQRFIEGEHLSVSMVGSRVVGNACNYYTGQPPLLLAVNRQYIDISPDGRFTYRGGETPIIHERQDDIVETAKKTITILGCQGYTGVDIVLADRPYVVDVNPRITTSIIGISACMKEEIAVILMEASTGKGPDKVHLTGSVRFDTHGGIERL
jgi:predicted ATP-grasp superfamily ATP-dependent carboligase